MSTDYLDVANKWFNEHLDELLRDHEGKWGVVLDQHLIGAYDEFSEAYEKGVSEAGTEKILIRQIVRHEESHEPPVNLTLGLLSAAEHVHQDH